MDNLHHIAFIMDGNGRWARRRLMPRKYGHREGVQAMKRVVDYCASIGLEAVSFYAFSTENWARPQDEVEQLFAMVKQFAEKEMVEYAKKGYVVRFMGDLTKLPQDTRVAIENIINSAKNNHGMTVNIGLNYGGRDEIVRACNNLILSGAAVTQETLSAAMDTVGLCDPDIIVRSAGEQRLSNFMLWQAAYSELIFRKEFWPDFDDKIVDKIVAEYSTRDRRYGSVK